MPWWAQRVYLEGMAEDEEVPIVFSEGTSPGTLSAPAFSGESLDPFASLDEFAAFGVSTERPQRG